jgi:ABC-type transport system involved in multi-copper enzyme maturation permease subunit
MPIYIRTYRSFDGAVRRRFRWAIVTEQELTILFRSRIFQGLLLLGYLHVILRILQIMAVDMLALTPQNPLVQAMKNMAIFTVDGEMFFDFLRLQTPLVFLTTIFAGSGMICDDFQNNLMEVYFSKPLTWRDYVLGKTATLIVVGLLFTALPGIVLTALHVALSPSWAVLSAMYQMPFAVALFSLTIVVPCTLGVLASSALFNSRRYSSIGVFMILFGDLVIGRILPDLLHQARYAIVAFPLALNRVGEALFSTHRPLFDISCPWSVWFIAVVCIAAFLIICQKARRAEMAL